MKNVNVIFPFLTTTTTTKYLW